MLLCLAPSPDDKRLYVVPACRPGGVHRAESVHRHPSGKGVNAARAAGCIGASVSLVTFAGETFMPSLEHSMRTGAVALAAVRTASPTRCCTTVIDRGDDSVTELVEEAASVTPEETGVFLRQARALLPHADALLLAGSLPAGFARERSADIVREAVRLGVPTVVDAHGAHLQALLGADPLVVRVNRQELLATVGGEDCDVEDCLRALRELGARNVVVSDGPHPVLLLAENEDHVDSIAVPRMQGPVNPVGSGDAMAGGIAAALAAGRPLRDAVLLGIAMGAANAETLLPGELDRDSALRYEAALGRG